MQEVAYLFIHSATRSPTLHGLRITPGRKHSTFLRVATQVYADFVKRLMGSDQTKIPKAFHLTTTCSDAAR